MPRWDRIGWLLFLLSAALFTIAGVRAGDWLVVAGSVVFGLACLFFLVPHRETPKTSSMSRADPPVR